MLFRPLATKYQTKNSRALPDDSSVKYLRKGRPWNDSSVEYQQRIRWNGSSVEYQQRTPLE
ncbi:hypothetical protein SAMN04488128_101366 [Chitinophaga eiseniae]|uniref:Uncharacterized protein n=1 Tax=Chitinophaga eiseniae TaxID=634771 RepID=A0A1T4KY72_9BACT|nr:hypothetical protein [Chitinophaga eiseniae]SJZ47379.1 hypothetical protein SAMN04488128_101366 [Chitinophaga eiseniae]